MKRILSALFMIPLLGLFVQNSGIALCWFEGHFEASGRLPVLQALETVILIQSNRSHETLQTTESSYVFKKSGFVRGEIGTEGGRKTAHVRIPGADSSPKDYFFDVASGRLGLREECDKNGRIHSSAYLDCRSTSGLYLPHIQLNRGPLPGGREEGSVEQKIIEVRFNEPIDRAFFEKPEFFRDAASSPQGDPPVAEEIIRRVILETADLIRDLYVDSAEAQKIADGLMDSLLDGGFKGRMSGSQLAVRLTECLNRLSGDKHMRAIFDPRLADEMDSWEKLSAEEKRNIEKEKTERARRQNFGFKKAEILDGNIGYLDFHIFDRSGPALETGTAALNFLANSEAVILDLRSNRGGHPRMVQLVASCFIEGRTHLNTFVGRNGQVQEEIWTLPRFPGRTMYDRDLYILTGPRTASAAESFTYIMKNLNRAVIVGENTAGAANPGGFRHVGEGFLVFIPTGKPVSPVTGTNWEGKGIEPDVKVSEILALRKAHSLALEKQRTKMK